MSENSLIIGKNTHLKKYVFIEFHGSQHAIRLGETVEKYFQVMLGAGRVATRRGGKISRTGDPVDVLRVGEKAKNGIKSCFTG